MDYFPSHTRKHPLKCSKKRLTQDQVRLLETSFNFNNKLDPDRKSQLAQELGLPPRQIAIWYQNKRARWKSQSMEEDYRALQLRLENALADNKRLEREIERLKQELGQAQDMFISVNSSTYYCSSSNVPSLSNSCDEVGSSSLFPYESKDHLEKELFACFSGAEGQFGKPDGYNFFSPSIS